MPWDFSMYGRQIQADQNAKLLEQKNMIAQRGGNVPAAIQIANEMQKALQTGDLERYNALALAAKTFDKGIIAGEGGIAMAMPNYAQQLGQLSYGKQAGQNQSDYEFANPTKFAERMGTLQADAQADRNKKAVQSNNQEPLLSQARSILSGTYKPAEGEQSVGKPTGSATGAIWDIGKKAFGVSDENSRANSKLSLIGANLTAQQPRFEGPQSDADRDYYEKMAGLVGDSTVPVEDRLAAIDEMERLNKKYSGGPDWGASNAAQNPNNPLPLPDPLQQLQSNANYGLEALLPAMPAPNATVQGAKPRLRYNPATGDFE